MVFKIINDATSWNADLYGEYYNYGTEKDTLKIEPDPPFTLIVKTYGQGDFVYTVGQAITGYTFANYYLGSGNDTLEGSRGHEWYYDQSGQDIVWMNAGNDRVFAGKGNDTIDGGDGVDSLFFSKIFDASNNSVDNTEGVTFHLNRTTTQDLGIFGTDMYRNFENVYGGKGEDTFFGTSGANIMHGRADDDYLRGYGGKDSIFGGDGRDTIIGDGGADRLYAAYDEDFVDGHRDVFKYLRLSDSTNTEMDTIFGFETAALLGSKSDRIDLSALDASTTQSGNNAFTFVGSTPFKLKGGEVRVVTFGNNTIVFVDIDADAEAEMTFVLVDAIGLTKTDFVL